MGKAPDKAAAPPRRKKWLRRIALWTGVFVAALVLTGILASWAIEEFCSPRPPDVWLRPKILDASVEEDKGVRRIGPCYLAERDGILRMSLEGDPFELGYCNASLTQAYIKRQEADLIATVRRFVPSDAALWLLRKIVLVRNRDLPAYVKPEYQMEIYGLARGYRDPFPELGPLYPRLLNYHAAHDISHSVMNHPLVGCTAFAAWGDATVDGHLLVGRNFDFNAGRSFDENKIVMRFKPADGLGFLSVAWPGLIGVVSGINDAKVAVTINACYSHETETIGTPVCLMLREVMQYAEDLDEAVDIIRYTKVFVADSYLVADGKTGKAVVVEKTPGHTEVREPENSTIVCANHFMTPALIDHPGNLEFMAENTTVARYDRMAVLVERHRGKLDPPTAASILRDRCGAGDCALGLGHEGVIAGMIATHSVIIDVTAGVIWVAASPHQLGAFVPFGLDAFEEPEGVAALPASPLLADGTYQRYLESLDAVAKGRALLEAGDAAGADREFRRAWDLNPDFYQTAVWIAKAAKALGKDDEARAWLGRASKLLPAMESERKGIRELGEGL